MLRWWLRGYRRIATATLQVPVGDDRNIYEALPQVDQAVIDRYGGPDEVKSQGMYLGGGWALIEIYGKVSTYGKPRR